MEDFTRELTPGNTKAAMKAVGAASSDPWKVAADDFNFAHDVAGIRRHIDRTTGKLMDCFLPRFAQ